MLIVEPNIQNKPKVLHLIVNDSVIDSSALLIDFTETFFGSSDTYLLIIPIGFPFYTENQGYNVSLRDIMFFDINPIITTSYQIDEPLTIESQFVSNLPIVVNNVLYHPAITQTEKLDLSNLKLCLLQLDITDTPDTTEIFDIDSYCRLPKMSLKFYDWINPSFWYIQVSDAYRDNGLNEQMLVLNPDLYYVYNDAPILITVDNSGAHVSSPLLDDITANHANENLAIRFNNESLIKLTNNLSSNQILSDIITDNTIDENAIALLNRNEATFNIQFSSSDKVLEFIQNWLGVNNIASVANNENWKLTKPIVIGLANGDVYIITGRYRDLFYVQISENIVSFNLKYFRFWKVNTYQPFIDWIVNQNKEQMFPLTVLKLWIVPDSFKVNIDKWQKFFVYFDLLPKHYFMSNSINILF